MVILRDGDGGPLVAEVGQDLSLLCNYQVMSDSLYSIKWYRDDKEFFRYIPRGNISSHHIARFHGINMINYEADEEIYSRN